MSQDSLKYLTFLKQQVACQEKLLAHHLKAESTLKLLLESDLIHQPYERLYHCLWGIHDAIEAARLLNEEQLHVFLEALTSLKTNQGPLGDDPIH